ncbi:hypothetical protein BDW75DRAFT_230720 [Aspergillus navahoensis]
MVQERWANELLCRLVARAQHNAELRNDLTHGSQLEQPQLRICKPAHQSIGEAIRGNHINIVEYLLERKNVLHLAARLCNPEMFRLLVPRFHEGIYQTDNCGDTALVRIIMNSSASGSRYESAKIILLQGDVHRNRHHWEGQQNPLQAAVQVGDIDMCCALISIGNMSLLDALTRDSEGLLILKDKLWGTRRTCSRFCNCYAHMRE